jgi:ceramide glucosyltransferase
MRAEDCCETVLTGRVILVGTQMIKPVIRLRSPGDSKSKSGDTIGMWMGTLAYLMLLPALAPLLYYCAAIYAGASFFRSRKNPNAADRSFAPPVSILKPVRGIDCEVYENFASMCRIDYEEYEIVFAVADADDPVIALIKRLQEEFPNRSIRLITHIEQRGHCRKTNSLRRLSEEAKYDLLVMNDSDVRVDKDYLWKVVAPFRDPKVGAVTALFRSKSAGGLAADVDAIGVPTDAAASTMVVWKFSKIDFAYGWTMAVTKERLKEIGGFDALVDMHSDDFALGHEIAKRGYRVELIREAVCVVFPDETLGDFLTHELRWCVQLKNLRPMGYVSMFLSFGMVWALLVAVMVPSAVIVASYALAYVVLRLAVAWVIGVWGLGDETVQHRPWLVFLRDAVNVVVYVASFFSNTVEWRGGSYYLRGPFMEPVPAKGGSPAPSVVGTTKFDTHAHNASHL